MDTYHSLCGFNARITTYQEFCIVYVHDPLASIIIIDLFLPSASEAIQLSVVFY